MAEEQPSTDEAFDLERLKELIALMETHGLTEVDLKRGGQRWRLRRGPQEVMQVIPGGPYPVAPSAIPAPVAPALAVAAQETAPAAPPDGTIEIISPTVGTFYSSPSPDDPVFVEVGTKVAADTIVCIIEAMKVMNEIQSELSGTITEVLIEDGEAVEYGQPLFKVKTA